MKAWWWGPEGGGLLWRGKDTGLEICLAAAWAVSCFLHELGGLLTMGGWIFGGVEYGWGIQNCLEQVGGVFAVEGLWSTWEHM
jgi:hypothetical protein